MGHEDGTDPARVRSASGLALLGDHAPSTVIACLNAIRVNDSEAIAALVPPSVPVDDHRAESNHRFDDGRSLVETLGRWGTELLFDLSLLAHRGTDHALVRLNLALEARTMGCLIGATCRDDQVRHLAVYDLEDLGRATYEVTMRWAQECGPAEAAMIEVSTRWLRTILERDFDACLDITGEDFAVEDHRPGSAARYEPPASFELLRGVLSDDDEVSDLLTEVIGYNAHASLSWRTQTTPGRLGEVDEELALAAVADGKVVLLELYEAHQLDRAMQRLADLGGSPSSGSNGGASGGVDAAHRTAAAPLRPTIVDDDPVRAVPWVHPELFVRGSVPDPIRAFVDAARAGDGVAMDAAADPGLVIDDLRDRTDTPMRSRAQALATLEAFGPNAFDIRLVALREDRLAVVRLLFERTEGGIADMTVLLTSDENLVTDIRVHDTADFVTVVKTLSEAHLALLGAEEQHVLGVSASVLRAIVDRRFDAVAEQLSPDFVYRDHRESMPVELDRDGSMALLSAVIGESPETFDYAPEVITVTPSGLLSTRTSTTLDRLGRTDVDVTAMRVRDGQLTRFEIFEHRDLDRARRLVSSWY